MTDKNYSEFIQFGDVLINKITKEEWYLKQSHFRLQNEALRVQAEEIYNWLIEQKEYIDLNVIDLLHLRTKYEIKFLGGGK